MSLKWAADTAVLDFSDQEHFQEYLSGPTSWCQLRVRINNKIKKKIAYKQLYDDHFTEERYFFNFRKVRKL